MSDLVPPTTNLNEEKEEKEIQKDNEEGKKEIQKENEEGKKEIQKENEEDVKEDKNEDIKEDEIEKSEEEKEKSESSKESNSESEESKKSKESKDKDENNSEENDEADEDDDDDDVDDNGGDSEESSDEDRQKDPHHGYLNSKTEYKNIFNDLGKNDFLYGFKQNKFYKIVDYKNLGEGRIQIYKYELKELKTENKEQKVNVKLVKNIQYMASIYGSAKIEETDKTEKDDKNKDIEEKEIKDKKDTENKNNNKDNQNIPEKNNEEIEEEKKDKNNSEKKEEVKTKENKEKAKDKQLEENPEKANDQKPEEKPENEGTKEDENKTKEKEEGKKAEKSSKNKKAKKPKNSNLKVVIKDFKEYTIFQKIRVIYLNSINNPVIFYYKININTTIKEIIEQFTSLFHYRREGYKDKIPLSIFINGKMHSISNSTRNKFFIPTKFDYKNDYVLILEKQVSKLIEFDLNTTYNRVNLRSAVVPHVVYNSLYNFEIESFLISKDMNFLDCQIYEVKKDINLRQFTDNEYTIKQKFKEFLDLNWKDKSTFLTSFISVKAKKGKDSYNCYLFELNRKFILLQGKIYIFVIKSSNKKIKTFGGKDIMTDGILIVSRNDKSIINGFRGKPISDFKAYS